MTQSRPGHSTNAYGERGGTTAPHHTSLHATPCGAASCSSRTAETVPPDFTTPTALPSPAPPHESTHMQSCSPLRVDGQACMPLALSAHADPPQPLAVQLETNRAPHTLTRGNIGTNPAPGRRQLTTSKQHTPSPRRLQNYARMHDMRARNPLPAEAGRVTAPRQQADTASKQPHSSSQRGASRAPFGHHEPAPYPNLTP